MVGRIDVNHIVPTAPPGTSDNRAASTAFVAAAVPGSPLPVANGGTGRTALTANAVLLGENTNPVNGAVGSDGQYLRGHTGADPSFGTIPVADLPAPWNSYSGGVWVNYTPTVTAPGGSSVSGSGTANYLQIGKIVFVMLDYIVTFTGAAAFITVSYPPVAPVFPVYSPGRENVTIGKMFTWRSSDGAFIAYDNTVFTGSGSEFVVNASYEAA